MSRLDFKSPDDGSILTFELISRDTAEVLFNVAVKNPWFTGAAPATTFVNGSPSILFRAMALEWKGWKQAKTWEDIEGRVAFEATSDSLGHISLATTLKGPNYDSCLRVVVKFEAGQLEEMKNEIETLLG
jgi:Family of unknown function (DUF6228)